MGLDEFLGKWGVLLCAIADGVLIVRLIAPLLPPPPLVLFPFCHEPLTPDTTYILFGLLFAGGRGGSDPWTAGPRCRPQGFGIIFGVLGIYYHDKIGGSEGPTECVAAGNTAVRICVYDRLGQTY
jgi:hypothetical protein